MEGVTDEDGHTIESVIITSDFDYAEATDTKDINTTNLLNSSAYSSPSTPKGKYYRQTYRTAWEHMPDFKGWLRGVAGEPTRAYCIYCEKTLHAHRLSLLKHTCTIRHQKAEQLHRTNKKNKLQISQKINIDTGHTSKDNDEEEVMNDDLVQYNNEAITSGQETEELDDDYDEVVDEEEDETMELDSQLKCSPDVISKPDGSKQPISITAQVFDTTRGTPVHNLQVVLYKLIDGRWTYVNEGTTNNEGHCFGFIDGSNISPGRFKLHFDVDRYFEIKKIKSIFPFVEIVFDCRERESYNLGLVLSPYGYSTYKS